MRTLIVLLCTVALGFVPLHSEGQTIQSQPGPILKVSVLSSGSVLLDGKPTTMKDLGDALKKAKSRNGQVWYYREAGRAEPGPKAFEVFKLIVDSKLPLSLSSKPDFSDYVDERGQSHPRQK